MHPRKHLAPLLAQQGDEQRHRLPGSWTSVQDWALGGSRNAARQGIHCSVPKAWTDPAGGARAAGLRGWKCVAELLSANNCIFGAC